MIDLIWRMTDDEVDARAIADEGDGWLAEMTCYDPDDETGEYEVPVYESAEEEGE